MKKVNNILIFIISLVSLLFAVKDFNIGHFDRLIGDLTIFFVLMIPRFISRITKLKISEEINFIYIIFIFLAQFIGCVVNLYNITNWYDLFIHFISGVLTGILSLVILNLFGMFNNKNKIFNILFMFSFSLFIASLWEFGEFLFDNILNLNVQHSIETGVSDTMTDMLIAFLGTIIMSFFYKIFNSKFLLNAILKTK